MKYPFLRRVLTLVLCTCLAVTLLTVFSPTRSAHAATMSAASCPGNLHMARGKTWNPGDVTTWHTCAGTSLKLTFQTDANFVLYIGGHAKWASHTNVGNPFDTVFQSDGNLVVYVGDPFSSCPCAAWASGTNGKGATTLSLQQDGNLVIYTGAGKALWSSRTCCWR